MTDDVTEPVYESRRALRAHTRGQRPRWRRAWAWWAIAVVVVLVAGIGTYVYAAFPLRAKAAAEEAVADLNDVRFDSTVWQDTSSAQALFDRVVVGLGDPLRTNGHVELGTVEAAADGALAHLKWTWTDAGGEAWSYESELPLQRNGLFWWADLTEEAINPELEPGGMLEARANPGKRGSLLAADGKTLMAEGPVVGIGVHPARLDVGTLDSLVTALNDFDPDLDLDATALEKRVDAVDKDQLVPVITLREADYRKVKDQIHDLPGVLFDEHTQTLSREKGFAEAVLGSAGAATAEDIEKSDGTLREGSIVGKSGLEQALDTRLGGPRNLEIFASGGKAGDLVSLYAFPQTDGHDVETTLDVAVQKAADTAVSTADKPAALVAVRPSDGHVLAAANYDPDGGAWDRALAGQYPPGSVFKVASGLALAQAGVGLDDTLDCPKTIEVDGKTFKNAEDHELGTVSFAENFAESCNTAFIGAADQVSSQDVADATAALGMSDFDLGALAKTADAPVDDDPVLHAAEMIGQGKVVASPLSVAIMAASVAEGTTVSPLLVTPDERHDKPAQDLDADAVKQVKTMMRRAVTDGTASALADVSGGDVYGKTGTAEYGNENPPRTHAWFAGFQGDLAVAVLVEDGGFGAEAAVPVAKEFFTTMAG